MQLRFTFPATLLVVATAASFAQAPSPNGLDASAARTAAVQSSVAQPPAGQPLVAQPPVAQSSAGQSVPLQGTGSVPVSAATPATAATPGTGAAIDPSAGKAVVSANSYVIGPEDSLQILVWHEPNLSSSLPVRPDGMISLALIGDITAAGLTPVQLGNDVAGRLKKYVNDPLVTVTVLTVHPKQIYLLGEVQHVGPIPMTADLTPLQAISAAGGLTPFANAKHTYILRVAQGKQQKIPFDYRKAVRDGNQQGVSLFAGDTIVVP